MWEVEGAEAALMEGLSVLASACEPSRDGGLTVAENPFSGGGVQPFGEGRQHEGDLLGRSFQAIERCVASSTEGGTTSLTAKRLDALGTAMRAIAYERMHVSSCDPAVSALRASTGIPFGVDAFGCSSATFHLAPWPHRSRRRYYSRRGRGGETTGRAVVWAAGLEKTGEPAANLGGCFRRDGTRTRKAVGTQEHQRDDQQAREQKHIHVHGACSSFAHEEECFLPRKEKKDCREGSQAGRSVVRFIHHREGLYRKVRMSVSTYDRRYMLPQACHHLELQLVSSVFWRGTWQTA